MTTFLPDACLRQSFFSAMLNMNHAPFRPYLRHGDFQQILITADETEAAGVGTVRDALGLRRYREPWPRVDTELYIFGHPKLFSTPHEALKLHKFSRNFLTNFTLP